MRLLRRKADCRARALLLSFAALSTVPTVATTAWAKEGQTKPAEAHTAVLPLSEGRNMLGLVYLPHDAKETPQFWKPGAEELRRLEAHVPHSVASYYRQYLGVTIGKTRLILINGFSEGVASEFKGGKFDWHKSTVRVMDGGSSFFHATYDPKTKAFAGPHFNGVG